MYDHVNFSTVSTTYTQALTSIQLNESQNFAVQSNVTVTTPAAVEFTEAGTNLLWVNDHGFTTGLKVQVSTTGTLPAGLSAATDYFVVGVDANTFRLATSLANALVGTIITITDSGTGTHTITATSLAGASIKIQESVDGQNWFDVSGVTANITATGVTLLQGTSKCGQIRPYLTMTAGQLNVTIKANLK